MSGIAQPVQRDVTGLLNAWSSEGDSLAIDRLAPSIMAELEVLAVRISQAKAATRPDLEPLELLSEAFLKLMEGQATSWPSRGHFYAYMAKTMRCLLIDRARRRLTQKQGGRLERVSLDGLTDDRNPERHSHESHHSAPATPTPALETDPTTGIAIHDALADLARIDERQVDIVCLRYLIGLTVEETAEALDISPRTVKREWRSARLWLHRALAAESM